MNDLIYLNQEKCGQARLTDIEEWGNIDNKERQELASRVADRFQEKAKAARLNVQWVPRSAMVRLKGKKKKETPSVADLEQLIEKSYEEIKASLS